MTSYTDLFSGNPLIPSQVSYRSITLSTNTALTWPISSEDTGNVTAYLMGVTPTVASLSLAMPNALFGSIGPISIIRNLGSYAFSVTDYDGNVIVSIPSGQIYLVYLTGNSSEAGTWASFALGIGTSSLDAASLAGLGLKAIVSTLNQTHPVSAKTASYAFTTNDRAQTVINTGGSVTFSFAAAATLGNDWFVLVKNSGSGTVTLDPNGSETIDGSATLVLNANDACFVITDGANFYTVGRGQSISTSITRLVKSVAGSADVTLTSTEAAYTLIEFTGILTGNINVIFPNTVNRWFLFNNTTGAYTLTVKTAAGTGVTITQATRDIIACDGTNLNEAVAIGSGTVQYVGAGTGLTGGPITTTGTLAIANTAVAAGAYGTSTSVATFTTNARGQLTAASSIAIPSASTSVLGLAQVATQTEVNLGVDATKTVSPSTLLNASFLSVIPSGSVMMYGASSAPSGWLNCDGTSYNTSTYTSLFTAIGYTYGGSTSTFKVPDARGRSPLGSGTGSGLTARAIGASGGEEGTALTAANNGPHAHTVSDPGHSHTVQARAAVTFAAGSANLASTTSPDTANATTTATTGITLGSSGSGTAHNTMHPFLVFNCIIKT